MKSITQKIAISFVLILVTVVLVYNLNMSHQADDNGSIRIIIVDESEVVVFDDQIMFESGDSLFDALDRFFEVSYETYTLGVIVLGISNDEFSVQTNWTDNFLAFELYDGTDFYLATVGVSNIEFKDNDQIRISVKSVLGGLS